MSHFPDTLAVLQQGIASRLHLGGQIAVYHRGKLILDHAFGESRPGVPFTKDDLPLWLSGGKPITAVAIMQLVERGLIALDTRIADVIPEFGVNGKEAITLKHCLTHTAGFRGPLNNFSPGTWEEILARVYALRQEPGWVPGEKAGYHIGSSWFVLGELVRRLDGRAIDQYVREEIFARLGDNEATVGMSEQEFDRFGSRIVPLYSVTAGEFSANLTHNTREAATVPRPGANARGRAVTLASFYESLRNDERLFWRYSLVLEMVSRVREGMFDHTFNATLDWGLGLLLDSKYYAGEHSYGYGPHALPETFGHSGNQTGVGFCDPVYELSVAWMCNAMPGEPLHQARQSAINAAIYRDLGLTEFHR